MTLVPHGTRKERAGPARRDPLRIACGPKRAPGRYDTVVCEKGQLKREFPLAVNTHIKGHAQNCQVKRLARLLKASRERQPHEASDTGEGQVWSTSVLQL